MKKAKIMLMAISVLAITGGVLAFKTHSTIGSGNICVTDPTNASGFCGLISIDYTVGNSNVDVSYSPAPSGVNTDAKCTTVQCTLEADVVPAF